MASPSTFNSANKDSAYWGYTAPSGKGTIERTQGYTFVRMLQNNLKGVMGNQGNVTTYPYKRSAVSGSTPTTSTIVNGGDLKVDGVWGPITSRVLAAYLMRFGGMAEMRAAADAVARTERDQKINPDAIKAGVFIGYGADSDPSTLLSSVTVFDGTVMPPWSKSPPKDMPNTAGAVDRIPVAAGYSLSDAATAMPDYNAAGVVTTPPGATTTPVVATSTPTQPPSRPTPNVPPPVVVATPDRTVVPPPAPPPATSAPPVPTPSAPGNTPDRSITTSNSPSFGGSKTTLFLGIGALVLAGGAVTYAILSSGSKS